VVIVNDREQEQGETQGVTVGHPQDLQIVVGAKEKFAFARFKKPKQTATKHNEFRLCN
jgi:hypothetical protein